MKARLVTAIVLVLVSLVGTSSLARAATWKVCPSGCDYVTIQAAIDAASSGDTIEIRAGTYTETVTITKDLSLIGQDDKVTSIDGNHAGKVVSVLIGVTALIRGVTIAGGSTTHDGGGIYNLGTLTLEHSTVMGNSANFGGGIFNGIGSDLTIRNSTISDNVSGFMGGGIITEGTLTMENSDIVGNAALFGGGILNGDNGRLTLSNSSLSDNIAHSVGGGLYNSGAAWIANAKITGNDAVVGGGIYNFGTVGEVTLSNTSVASNTATTGGGIYNERSVTLDNSKVKKNEPDDCVGVVC
jgi:hypothetical protein